VRSEIENVFTLSNVWLSYPGSPVLRGLSLEVKKGEVFVVIGPSGEGKSSLLKLMAGLIKADQGQVEFCGCVLHQLSRKNRSLIIRRMGMTFQKSGLFDSLSCADNLRFPLRELTQLSSREIEHRVDQLLS